MPNDLKETFMTYSVENDALIEEFIEYFGIENIPNPDQYPKRLEFLIKTFKYYKSMENLNDEN